MKSNVCVELLSDIRLVTTMFTVTTMGGVFKVIFLLLWIIPLVSSQCSEAHRQTCAWSFMQLNDLNTQLSASSTRFIPDFNETTLRNTCNLYSEYRNCTLPFLEACNPETVIQLHTFDAALGQICGDLFTGYLQHRSCYNRLQSSYSTCQEKQIATIESTSSSSTAYKYLLCSSAKDYVLCIYTSTALGCSMPAADVYFKLLNNSISDMFFRYTYTCNINHPMDVISIYTTTPSTTTIGSKDTSTVDDDKVENPVALPNDVSGCSLISKTIPHITYLLIFTILNAHVITL